MEKLNLNNTLMLNATLTLPFAIILFIFSGLFASLLGMGALVIELLAAGLVLFSIVAWLAAKKSNILIAQLITLLDISWVLASGMLVVMNPYNMTLLATVLVIITALLVLFFALFQLRGILQRSAVENAP
jgi:hypothetical protein